MNKVQEALKAAIEVIEQAIPDKRGEFEEQQKLYENYPNLAYKYDYLKVEADEMQQALDKCKAALSDIEKCEPVAEAIRERDRLGFAVVNVIGKLDEIIENTREVEINELQAALEDMPKRADLYTSPQPIEKCEPVVNRNEAVSHLWESIGRWSAYLASNGEQAELSPPSWLIDAVRKATSPQPREWVGLTYKDKVDLRENNDWYNFPNDLIEATEAKCKQLNTKG